MCALMSPSSPRPYANGRTSLFRSNSSNNNNNNNRGKKIMSRRTNKKKSSIATTTTGSNNNSNSNSNSNNMQVSRAVHFHKKVLIRSNNDLNTNTSTTYLSSNELANIQNDIFWTFDCMNMVELRYHNNNVNVNVNINVNMNNGLPLYLCARGLEEYSTEHKGYLKSSTITRRQNAVYAVLQEQERQRQEQRQLQQQQMMMIQQNQQHHGMIYNNNNNYRITYDESRIRLVYEQYTLPNQNNASVLGGYDSEEAFKVYSEQQL